MKLEHCSTQWTLVEITNDQYQTLWDHKGKISPSWMSLQRLPEKKGDHRALRNGTLCGVLAQGRVHSGRGTATDTHGHESGSLARAPARCSGYPEHHFNLSSASWELQPVPSTSICSLVAMGK